MNSILLLAAMTVLNCSEYEFRIKTDEYKEKSVLSYKDARTRLQSLPLKDDVLSRVYCYYEDEEVTIYIYRRWKTNVDLYR